MTKLLSREAILAAPEASATFEDVEVPEWGGVVRVRAMSGAERDRFEESLYKGKGKNRRLSLDNARARLAAWTLTDEKGEKLFSQADIQVLGRKSAAALQRVFNVAQALSGISDEDLDDLTENFTDDPSGDSTLD